MHVSVIGAGAVGGTLAALLDRAGVPVSVVARGATLDSIRSHGIHLSGASGAHTARVAAGASVSPAADAVILAVRAHQTAAAMAQYATEIGGRDVLVLQNGVRGPETVAGALGRARGVFGLLATFPATLLGPGRVRLTGPGELRLGPLRVADAARAGELAALLNRALPTHSTSNLPGLLWQKLLLNQVNALPAITGTSVQYVCAHPGLRGMLAASLTETVRVVDARGIRLASSGGLHPRHAAIIRAGNADAVVRARLGRMFGVTPNPASTLQALRRGEPTEIDALNGEVVHSGRLLRIPTPMNALLTELVHEVSETRRFLPAREVMRRWRSSVAASS